MNPPNGFEAILLDFRYFLDEALTLIEFFASSSSSFRTTNDELDRLRGYAKHYTRLVLDLKKRLDEDYYFTEFNVGLTFSESFKSKRIHFFTLVFNRLEKLFKRVNECDSELVCVYFKLVQKLTRKTNEFIGYVESSRWHRAMALQILDKLVAIVNGFSRMFERFVEFLQLHEQIDEDANSSSNDLVVTKSRM